MRTSFARGSGMGRSTSDNGPLASATWTNRMFFAAAALGDSRVRRRCLSWPLQGRGYIIHHYQIKLEEANMARTPCSLSDRRPASACEGLALMPEDLKAQEAAPLLCAGITTFNAL